MDLPVQAAPVVLTAAGTEADAAAEAMAVAADVGVEEVAVGTKSVNDNGAGLAGAVASLP